MDYSLVTDENVDEITISYSQFSTRKSYYDYRRELKSSGLFINSEQRDNGKATWYRISKLDLDKFSNLEEVYSYYNIKVSEGYSQQCLGEVKRLEQLVNQVCSDSNVSCKIVEIGFNGGHSAEVFLKAKSSVLTSFDIGIHHYLKVGKRFIDQKFAGRHTMIYGDSTKTVPDFGNNTFDLIFIDGGHDYEIARDDLKNCQKLAHKNTIVVMDDVHYTNPNFFNVGPNKAWLGMVSQGKIKEIGHEEYGPGRGLSWGYYVN